jgi:hypothetical protein
MGIQDRYLAYAQAFEQSYEDGDWSRIEQYFTKDAVYEGEPLARGRDAVLARLENAVGSFDQRMDSRTLTFEKPTTSGNEVKVRWKAAYTKRGLPDLVITGVEIATFEGDRIANLRDDFDPAAQKAMGEWMAKHGKVLEG